MINTFFFQTLKRFKCILILNQSQNLFLTTFSKASLLQTCREFIPHFFPPQIPFVKIYDVHLLRNQPLGISL